MNCLSRIDRPMNNRLKSDVEADASDEKLQIPLDLSEWCEKSKLLEWINLELDTLDWSHPDLITFLRAHPSYQPRMLLCVMTFAYATGTFESEEIVRLCYVEEPFRALCTAAIPTPAELVRFRRENRGLLKWLVGQVLRRALREKFSLGNMLLPAGLRQFLAETANVRLDIARHVDRATQGA